MTSNRLILIVGGIVAALLVAVLIVGAMLLGQIQQDAENRAYQACMARHGFAVDEADAVRPGDEDAYLHDITAAANACLPD